MLLQEKRWSRCTLTSACSACGKPGRTQSCWTMMTSCDVAVSCAAAVIRRRAFGWKGVLQAPRPALRHRGGVFPSSVHAARCVLLVKGEGSGRLIDVSWRWIFSRSFPRLIKDWKHKRKTLNCDRHVLSLFNLFAGLLKFGIFLEFYMRTSVVKHQTIDFQLLSSSYHVEKVLFRVEVSSSLAETIVNSGLIPCLILVQYHTEPFWGFLLFASCSGQL